MAETYRALHWCLKIGSRRKSMDFYTNILGMKLFRHEEFSEGCDATCNGPYNNRWSKSMIGYGQDESTSFALELTYNYPIREYKLGNDMKRMVLKSTQAIENVKQRNYPSVATEDGVEIRDPDGYRFLLQPGDNHLARLALNITDLSKSIAYWHDFIGLKIRNQEEKRIELEVPGQDWIFELNVIDEPLDHATGWGRIAFAAPIDAVRRLAAQSKAKSYETLHDLRELGTPGKDTVTVVILKDTDGYEICFVGAENWEKLSQADPNAEKELHKFMRKDVQ